MTGVILHSRAIVISDLHLGDGNVLEDFNRDVDFVRLLEEVIPQRTEPTTLIINGDFIDFPQVLPEHAQHGLGDRIGVTECQSHAKLERVLRTHRDVFDAMQRYLRRGQILLLPGNHDVDLHWLAVQRSLRDALGADAPAYQFIDRGVIEERGVYIEHGNQYTYDNRFERWDRPIFDNAPGGPRLERPWGTLFMDLAYNDLELRYPFINKAYPHGRLAWIALRSLLNDERISVRALARMAVFFVTHGKRMVAEHLLGDAPDHRPVCYADDISQLLEAVGHSARSDRVAGITEEALRLLGPELPAEPDPAAPVPGLLGRNDDDALTARARGLLQNGIAKVVAFGHTHEAVDGNARPSFGPADPRRWFNTGSWTPSIPVTGHESWSDLAKKEWTHALHYLEIELGDPPLATLQTLPASAPPSAATKEGWNEQ
jgi:UDP-2,3-diacylglucosamine pyrophosphatase LpxH